MKMPNISLMELYNKLAQQQALFGEKIERIYDVISGSLQIPLDVTNSNDYPSLWPDTGLNVYAILPEYNLAETMCTSGIVFNIGQGRHKYQMMIVQQDELNSEKNGKMYYRYAKPSGDVWSGWKRSMYAYELTGGRDADGNHYKDDFGDILTDTEDNDPDMNGEYSSEEEASTIFTLDEETGDIVVTDEDNTTSSSIKLFMNLDANTIAPVEEIGTGDSFNTNFRISSSDNNEVVVTEPYIKGVSLVSDRAYTADTLTNSREISLKGDVVGSAIFDGSKDISINVSSKNLVPINVNVPAFTSVATTYRLLCTFPPDNTISHNYVSINGHIGGFESTEGKCIFNISASNSGEWKIDATLTGSINEKKLDIIAVSDTVGDYSGNIYIFLVAYQYCNVDDVKISIVGSDDVTIENEITTLQQLNIPYQITDTNEIIPHEQAKVWSLAENAIRFEGKTMYGNVQGNSITSNFANRADVINISPNNNEKLHLIGINDNLSEHFYDTNINITAEDGGMEMLKLTANEATIDTLTGDTITCNDLGTHTFHADIIYSIMANDYAEYFPRGEETEFGDVIMLDVNSNKEQYIKACEASDCDDDSYCVVGVQSDTYGHIVGGCDGTDEEKLKHFIPIGLAGRVRVKFLGKAKKGAKVVPTHNGCARIFNKNTDDVNNVIGYLVEDDNRTDVRRLNMKIK